mmetsp:Transcript_12205/g.30027  ORF Transcript_12205/g.30027 Transcript_12205/m.30027 type:complete len:229 (-) Transcript_12205:73-759(-)
MFPGFFRVTLLRLWSHPPFSDSIPACWLELVAFGFRLDSFFSIVLRSLAFITKLGCALLLLPSEMVELFSSIASEAPGRFLFLRVSEEDCACTRVFGFCRRRGRLKLHISQLTVASKFFIVHWAQIQKPSSWSGGSGMHSWRWRESGLRAFDLLFISSPCPILPSLPSQSPFPSLKLPSVISAVASCPLNREYAHTSKPPTHPPMHTWAPVQSRCGSKGTSERGESAQ